MNQFVSPLPPPRGDSQALSWVLCLCDAVMKAREDNIPHCEILLENIVWNIKKNEPMLVNKPPLKPITEGEDILALARLAQIWLSPRGSMQDPWKTILARAHSSNVKERYLSVCDFAHTIRVAFMPKNLHRRWIWFIVLSLLAWILVPLIAILWKYFH